MLHRPNGVTIRVHKPRLSEDLAGERSSTDPRGWLVAPTHLGFQSVIKVRCRFGGCLAGTLLLAMTLSSESIKGAIHEYE